jgi:hypothetical protein
MNRRDSYANETPRDASDDADEATLKTRIAVLEEENARLRNAYGRIRRQRYRRTAFGLFVLGVLATLGGLFFSTSRDVLFALGGTGLFAGVLTYYLTPEQFIAASVGEKVYSALAESRSEMTAELDLSEVRVYVPSSDGTRSVRLFVPQHADYEIPDGVDRTFVTADGRRRGVTFRPSGAGLYEEFERALDAPLGDRPEPLTEQLADGVVEQFELAAEVGTDVDTSGSQAIFEVTNSTLGRVDQFDHPIPSFVAVGLALGLGEPVEVETIGTADDYSGEYLITCRWESGRTGDSTSGPEMPTE